MEREDNRNRRAGAAKKAAGGEKRSYTPPRNRRDPRKTNAGDSPPAQKSADERAARPKPWLERPWQKDDG
eukprot:6162033-Prymnesium_polylepis.1